MSNCKALDAELAMAHANTDMAKSNAIHTQVLSVEKLENMGLSDLANGARSMLAKMLEMPEQAPKHNPSEQIDLQQQDTPAVMDPEHDVVLVLNGATGTGKGALINLIGKLLLDRDFQVEGVEGVEDGLLIRDPVSTLKNREANQAMGCGPVAPVHMLTPSEYDVAKLLNSRLWKVLHDLPHGRGYRELTVEQLTARLCDEIVEYDRTKATEKAITDDIERRGRIDAAVKALEAEGIQVFLPLA